jgi:hypothetical protein
MKSDTRSIPKPPPPTDATHSRDKGQAKANASKEVTRAMITAALEEAAAEVSEPPVSAISLPVFDDEILAKRTASEDLLDAIEDDDDVLDAIGAEIDAVMAVEPERPVSAIALPAIDPTNLEIEPDPSGSFDDLGDLGDLDDLDDVGAPGESEMNLEVFDELNSFDDDQGELIKDAESLDTGMDVSTRVFAHGEAPNLETLFDSLGTAPETPSGRIAAVPPPPPRKGDTARIPPPPRRPDTSRVPPVPAQPTPTAFERAAKVAPGAPPPTADRKPVPRKAAPSAPMPPVTEIGEALETFEEVSVDRVAAPPKPARRAAPKQADTQDDEDVFEEVSLDIRGNIRSVQIVE